MATDQSLLWSRQEVRKAKKQKAVQSDVHIGPFSRLEIQLKRFTVPTLPLGACLKKGGIYAEI